MTEEDSKHGYMGEECKEREIVNEKDNCNKEEQEEGGDDIFFQVKQINVHAGVNVYKGIVV